MRIIRYSVLQSLYLTLCLPALRVYSSILCLNFILQKNLYLDIKYLTP